MSFSRHAYRHAMKPPASSTSDHLWISDDLLATTFRHFANGQRRHGSCVPGPLEARRRLAKRRNTALAGIGGVEDIACLFGRNGREHMKWTDHPWQRAQLETQDLRSYAIASHEVPLPFYDHNPEPIDSHVSDNPCVTPDAEPKTKDEVWMEFLNKNDWGMEDARDFARYLKIDLQREPEYSQQIFKKLLTRSTTDLTQAIRFLDDPFLNTRGSGNYLAAVELFAKKKSTRSNRTAVLYAVTRALELGLVPTEEICLIIKTLPNIIVERNKTLGSWDQKALLKHYRAMWTAIGRCNILGYHDLEKEVTDTWLQQLLSIRGFRFAEEIIVATHSASSDDYWPSAMVMAWLKALDADCAAKCVINVTQLLTLAVREGKGRNQQLERWREFLTSLSSIEAIASSRIWLDLPLAYAEIPRKTTSPPILTDRPIYLLFGLFETTVRNTEGSFLADLMRGVQSLGIPHNNLLQLAVDLKLRKLTTKFTRRTLERLETSQTTLAEVWTKPAEYNGIRALFYGTFDRMLRRVDLTSPAMMQECLRLAREGDPKSVWSILRLLDNHIPFKICLNKAWVPIPHPDDMALVRYHPGPRDSQCPDPYIAVDLIHQLAVALSCSTQLNPSRSFHLIHWLYDYLRKHGGPVYPSLVRAMYHAGVVRFRRQGLRVSATRYEYILWIMEKFEGRAVVKELTAGPQIGRSYHGQP
ncbi:uncharacterized protein N7477_009704 [Penicillium maclennaniae]|uniref:uncharacterized protein n=1 Tax=Penicillium maclennaniae TaxID=1343394 RepID=UPI0025413CDD|nr:uncharacterized protein N7477_009704 [Penicillium maclennaniae]KAJ5662088.1 hypothetical protein N7477_009704 [Penicillium maclennaniae]